MRKKRGSLKGAQLSIFMMLAALMLLGGVVWFVIIDASEKGTPVPREAAPLQTFITACAKDAGEKAMRQIGYTGGYADIPPSIGSNPAASLQTGPFASLRQPYWWHDGISSVPPLDFIQKEAERATAREFLACIDNFSAFTNLYKITAPGNPLAEVRFNKEGTSVSIIYPINAVTGDNSTTFSEQEFTAELPIRFANIYTLATAMMERENKDAFIERKTIDLMAMDQENIPLAGVEFDCSPRTWLQDEVRQRLQELMSVNLPFIKVKGTPYLTTQYVPNPEGAQETFENSYYNQHYIWDLGVEDFEGLKAGFTYDSKWPIIFTARPSAGGIMRAEPQEGTDVLSKVCLNIYHFTYDMAFPVKADIIDENPQQPYVFSFAFMAAIDHNQPSRQNSGYSLFDQEESIVSDEYCANKDVEATILTVDNVTGDAVKGANLTFTCGRFTCGMGATEWFGFGAAAGIVAKFPRCTNGVLRAAAPGYLESAQFLQTESDGTSTLVFLTPVKDISRITIVKHPFSNPIQEELLSASESASIVLRATDNSFQTHTLTPSSASLPLQFLMDKEYTYHVSIRLLNDEDTLGGYEGEWTPSLGQIQHANTLTFHVIQHEAKTEDEQFSFISDLAAHSSKVPLPQIT
ncbi:MAG: hypothetical protein HY518_02885 [Candidatus Aenigmarchaeota archaeon]|nr:hypothetical protein [Candidatus Aenigmarchaeota archaeon]